MKRFTGLGGFADVDALSSPHTQGSDAGYLYQPSRYYSLGRLRRMLQANGFKALQSTNHPKTNALQVTTIQAVRAGNSSDVLGKSGNAAIGR